MVDFSTSDAPEPPDLDALDYRVTSLHDLFQNSPTRFSDTATLLPNLIRDVGHATRAFRTPGEATQRGACERRMRTPLFLLLQHVAVSPSVSRLSRVSVSQRAGITAVSNPGGAQSGDRPTAHRPPRVSNSSRIEVQSRCSIECRHPRE